MDRGSISVSLESGSVVVQIRTRDGYVATAVIVPEGGEALAAALLVRSREARAAAAMERAASPVVH